MDELFSSAARLGQSLGSSPVVSAFVSERSAALTGGPESQPLPHHALLQMFLNSGGFNSHPLLIGWWLSGMPQGQQLRGMPEAATFLDAAQRSASAFLLIMEWLRSWLPGYPVGFNLPHVDPLASRVYRRGIPNQKLPWPLELRRATLHLVPEIDDQLAEVLEMDRQDLRSTLLELRRLLWSSAEWQTLRAARDDLDGLAMGRLAEIVTAFRTECRLLATSATQRLMSDDAGRRAALDRARERAQDMDTVARYYAAFEAVDHLLEGIAALITQFALGEGIVSVTASQLSWRLRLDPELRFTVVNQAIWLRMNQVVHVVSVLDELQCLVRVEGSTTNWDHRLGEITRMLGPIVSVGQDATPDLLPEDSSSFLTEITRS